MADTLESFSDHEKDILQEIMNIAFGNATADLAEVVDIYVMLSVPSVQVVKIGELSNYLKDTIKSEGASNIIEQKFWGNFKGSGLLVFPGGTERDLLALMEEQPRDEVEDTPMATLEQGGLLEIGNILIGACVGKVTELLDTFVTYSPPMVLQGELNNCDFLFEHFDPAQTAIIMKTVFTFEKKDISGFLLILTNHDSVGWLRDALNEFLDSYE